MGRERLRSSVGDGSGTFCFLSQAQKLRLPIDQFFEKIGITLRVVMEPFDTETIKSMVESGFGWSLLPEHALCQRSRFFRTTRTVQADITNIDATYHSLQATFEQRMSHGLNVLNHPNFAPETISTDAVNSADQIGAFDKLNGNSAFGTFPAGQVADPRIAQFAAKVIF